MKANNSTSLFQKDQVIESLKQSFVKLNPKTLIKNPVMFTVEVSTFFMLLVTIYSAFSNTQGSFVYNLLVFVILFIPYFLPILPKRLPRLAVKLRPIACVKPVKKHLPNLWSTVK